MKRVYIAGALNGDAVSYIKNVYKMVQWSEKVRKLGFSVFVPGIDFLQGVILGDWNYDDYFNNSQPWLEVADALFVTPGWEHSKGTKREIHKAMELSIPVFYDLVDLKERFSK